MAEWSNAPDCKSGLETVNTLVQIQPPAPLKEDKMLITRTSILSGITRSQELPISQDAMDAWIRGVLIQHAMPYLTDDEREFVLSGITPEEWDEYLGEESDED